MAEKPKVSIIFVHYSTDEIKSEMGRFCLKQLKRTLNSECELIVVNNGKLDGDFEDYADIYIDNSSNNSLGMARNKGFDASSGEYVCFIDNDVFVEEGWWQECIKILDYRDKLIASPVYTSCHVFNKKYQAGKIGEHLLNKRSGSPCQLMKKSAFESIGIFREGKGNSGDGGDFTNRFNKQGYDVILTKKMVGHHLGTKKYAY